MPDAECIADRFVVIDRRHAIDLATGGTITLVVGPAGEREEQLRWANRCDEQYLGAAVDETCLIDFGLHGDSSRFEAWGPPRPRHGERPIEAALVEIFENGGGCSHALRVFGPPGAGKSALLARLARSARLRGF